MADVSSYTTVDMSGAVSGGVIHEDVMDTLYSIDPVDRPFIDMIESVSVAATKKEYVERSLRARNQHNAAVDGQPVTKNGAEAGNRLAAYTQIVYDGVEVSTRSQAVDPIARGNELLFQVAMVQREVRRDEESVMLSPFGSQPGTKDVADYDDTTGIGAGAAKLPGAPAWLGIHRDMGTNGVGPTLSETTGGYPIIIDESVSPLAVVTGVKRALSDGTVRDMLEDLYVEGATPSVIMSTPKMIRRYSTFQFTDAARIATLESDKQQPRSDMPDGGGLVAYSSVSVLASDFGFVIQLVPNRNMLNYNSDSGGTPGDEDACDMLLLDPEMWAHGTLRGYQTEPLAKQGLSDRRMVSADVTLLCLQRKASGCIADLDPTTDVLV